MSIEISLAGKTAIVAGAGRGIGSGVARCLASAGANVVVVDKIEDRARQVADSIVADRGTAAALVADLLEPADSDMIVRTTVEQFGRVDILANVAGGAWAYVPYRRMHDMTDHEWGLVFNLNLNYVFTLTRATIRAMLAQGGGGAIVNIASIAGIFSSPNSSAYGAAKAGIVSLTRTLAHEYGPDGIRINAVAPGRVETPAASSETLDTAQLEDYSETIPMGFLGDPADIGNAVVFFASDLARYVTGQTLLVDGGASTTSAIMTSTGAQRIPSDIVRGRP